MFCQMNAKMLTPDIQKTVGTHMCMCGSLTKVSESAESCTHTNKQLSTPSFGLMTALSDYLFLPEVSE